MNEHDLHRLRSTRSVGLPDCRPVEAVVARGARLRRRRQAVQALGVTAVAGSVAAVGVLAPNRPDTTTAPGAPTPPAELLPAPTPLCDGTGERVAVGEVDDLRLLPTWLPAGVELESVAARRIATECPTPDPALALLRTGADGRVDGSLLLHGPFDGWASLPDEPTPTQVRGVDAGIWVYDDAGIRQVDLVWTEADGASWWIVADGLDEAQARTIAEALVLDSRLGSGPAGSIPADQLPPGWEVTWQAPDTPEVEPPARLVWSVDAADDRCGVEVTERPGAAPATAVLVETGAELVTVRGQDAMALPELDDMQILRWSEPSGIDIGVWCRDVPLTDIRQLAESLELVAADDPRLPPEAAPDTD